MRKEKYFFSRKTFMNEMEKKCLACSESETVNDDDEKKRWR